MSNKYLLCHFRPLARLEDLPENLNAYITKAFGEFRIKCENDILIFLDIFFFKS